MNTTVKMITYYLKFKTTCINMYELFIITSKRVIDSGRSILPILCNKFNVYFDIGFYK